MLCQVILPTLAVLPSVVALRVSGQNASLGALKSLRGVASGLHKKAKSMVANRSHGQSEFVPAAAASKPRAERVSTNVSLQQVHESSPSDLEIQLYLQRALDSQSLDEMKQLIADKWVKVNSKAARKVAVSAVEMLGSSSFELVRLLVTAGDHSTLGKVEYETACYEDRQGKGSVLYLIDAAVYYGHLSILKYLVEDIEDVKITSLRALEMANAARARGHDSVSRYIEDLDEQGHFVLRSTDF